MRRLQLAIVLLATLFVFVPARPAHAAVTVTWRSATTQVAHLATKTLKAPCPAGTAAMSGGGSISGLSAQTRIHSTYPYDGTDSDTKPEDGWATAYSNATGSTQTMTTYAVCVSGVTTMRYIRATSPQFGSGGAFLRVECPEGFVVLGGGGKISGNTNPPSFALQAAFGESGTGAEFSVSARRSTSSGVTKTLTGHAVCGKDLDNVGNFLDTTVNAGTVSGMKEMDCASGFTGGGVEWLSGSMQFLHTSAPADDDGDKVPDTWRARVINAGGTAAQMRLHALCLQ